MTDHVSVTEGLPMKPVRPKRVTGAKVSNEGESKDWKMDDGRTGLTVIE